MPNLVILRVSGTVRKSKVEDVTAAAPAASSSASTTPGFRAFKRARSGSTSEVTAETLTFNEALQFLVTDEGAYKDFPVFDPEIRTSVCSMSVNNSVRLQWLETITLPEDLIAQFNGLILDATNGFTFSGELIVEITNVEGFSPMSQGRNVYANLTPEAFNEILEKIKSFKQSLQLPQSFVDEVNNARTRTKAEPYDAATKSSPSYSPA